MIRNNILRSIMRNQKNPKIVSHYGKILCNLGMFILKLECFLVPTDREKFIKFIRESGVIFQRRNRDL